LPFNYQFQGR